MYFSNPGTVHIFFNTPISHFNRRNRHLNTHTNAERGFAL
jgi:hypothetical protein